MLKSRGCFNCGKEFLSNRLSMIFCCCKCRECYRRNVFKNSFGFAMENTYTKKMYERNVVTNLRYTIYVTKYGRIRENFWWAG